MTEHRWREGAALVIVIWAMAIIGAVVAAYFTRGLLEAKFTRDQRDEAEARALARAGMEYFLQRFLADENETDAPDASWLLSEDNPIPAFPEGTATARVSDWGSRVNLNLVGEAALLALFNGQKAPVDAILDWRDENGEPRPAGAEEEYYHDLTPPVAPANGMFTCPEEVLLVKEMDKPKLRKILETETVVYGRANPNLVGQDVWRVILRVAGLDELQISLIAEQFTLARAEAASGGRVPFGKPDDLRRLQSATYRTVELLTPYLTFTGQINPNLASERALQVGLGLLGLKTDKAAAIVEAREANPFKSLDEFRGLLARDEPKGVNKDWSEQVFTLQTTLVSVGVIGRTKTGALYRLEAVVERFHPPHQSTRWQCRFLYWREWPGQDFPPPTTDEGGQ